LSPPPEQWMQKRLHLWLEIGDLKSLGALGALWELSGSSLGARRSCAYDRRTNGCNSHFF
jgi:hypothetical protein